MTVNAHFGLYRQVRIALLLAAGLSASSMQPAWAAGPFAGFAGTWIGGGDISMTDGSREKIRCKASYSANSGASALTLHVVCASDSYKVDLVSSVVARGKSFSGTWQESTHDVQGDVTGSIPAPGEMQASLEGTGFGFQMSASTNGKQQAIKIIPQGTSVQGVNITLHKG